MILREALTGARERLRSAGCEEADLEAELLLRHALGVNRAGLFLRLEEPVPGSVSQLLDQMIERRSQSEPTAYIVGQREFASLDFEVTPATLIPRPETEMLVEAVIERACHLQAPRIADIGTGSGAIAVALAVALPNALLYATDASGRALDVARRNAARHEVGRRIAFRRGNLLEPLSERMNVIAANLPYVTLSDWQQLPDSIRAHEPRTALESGIDGLDAIRALLQQVAFYLNPGGLVCLEFGIGQAEAIEALARRFLPSAAVQIESDFAGIPRLLLAQTS